MFARDVRIIKKFEGTHRKAIIKTSATDDNYTVSFYYDDSADYEWKRGADGVPMDTCTTLKQAIGKAKRYVEKDYK